MPKGVVNCGNCVNTVMSTLFGKTFEEIAVTEPGVRVHFAEVRDAFDA